MSRTPRETDEMLRALDEEFGDQVETDQGMIFIDDRPDYAAIDAELMIDPGFSLFARMLYALLAAHQQTRFDRGRTEVDKLCASEKGQKALAELRRCNAIRIGEDGEIEVLL